MASISDAYQRWLGIPPEEHPPNHYRLLGLPLFESRPEVIERAADQQIARLQAIQPGPHQGLHERLLSEVAAARLCLLHPARKLEYDESLRQQAQSGLPAQPPPAAGGELPGLFTEPAGGGKARPGRGKRLLAAALLAAGAVATAVLLWGPRGEEPVLADGTLLIDWPEEQRPGATLQLNGVAQAVPGMGPVEYPCRPGDVRLVVAAPGRPTVERTVVIQSERKRLVSVGWHGPPAAGASAPPKTAGRESPRLGDAPPKGPATKTAAAEKLPLPDPKEEPAPDPAEAPARPEPGPPKTAVATPEPPEETPAAKADPARPTSTSPGASASPKKPPAKEGPKPIPSNVPTVADYDAPVSEVWQLVQQKETKQAHEKLLQIYKKDRSDFRVAFSLGIIEALSKHDWVEAEKHFEACFRLLPDHLPTVNNLALVRARTGDEQQAIRHWEAILAAGPAPPEVIQNLRRFQSYVHAGNVKLKPSQVKAIDDLATRASPTGEGYKANVGYLYMPLATADGAIVGYQDMRAYHDRWCQPCGGVGAVRCTNRECSQGTVRQMQTRVISRNPATKAPITETVAIRVPCPTCKGQGRIDCKKCDQGINPNLK